MFLFRIDIRVGLWGMGVMYSGMLDRMEAVRRNLGLRMVGGLLVEMSLARIPRQQVLIPEKRGWFN